MKKISVITVVYNGQNVIERTINSVVSQTYRENIEYIIIDGASKDNTLNIVKKYEQDIDIIVSEPDSGIYDAMNKGIDLASGEWISFMNADDIFADNHVLERVMSIVDGSEDVICGRTDYISESDEFMYKDSLRPVDTIFDRMPFCPQSSLVRSELLKGLKLDANFRIIADYDFFMKIYLNGAKFRYVDLTVAVFRWGGLSTTSVFTAAIETIYAILKNTSSETAKKSSIYKDLRFLGIGESELVLLDQANKKFISKTQELENLNNRINMLNSEIERFYSAKVFKFVRVITSPFSKVAKIFGK